MTREQYYEMCEALGSEPIESEIPIEYEDLYNEVQESVSVYNMLQDSWDGMNGVYLGKNYSGIKDIMQVLDVDDTRTCYSILHIIDRVRSEILNANKTKKAAK